MNRVSAGGPLRVATHATFFAIACQIGACSKPDASREARTIAVPVAVVTPIGASATDAATRYPLTIAYDREANLSFRVPGVVDRLTVRIGARIRRGDDVAHLDATPYRSARTRAEQDVAKLERAIGRSRELVVAGAVAPAVDEDNGSALQAARAALEAARYDEQSAVVRSPFPAVVLTRSIEVGETVAPGQAVVRVADLRSPLIGRVEVPRSVAATLRPGDPAHVFGDGAAPLAAVVRHVGAAADPKTGTVEVELTLPVGTDLPSGFAASASFARAAADSAGTQRLPAEALLDAADGRGHVYIVDPRTSNARKVAVAVRGFDGEWLGVSGLDPSVQVITYGAGFVRDGEKVTVTRQ